MLASNNSTVCENIVNLCARMSTNAHNPAKIRQNWANFRQIGC